MTEVILISGSRNYSDKNKIEGVINYYSNNSIVKIIHGDCSGADRIADEVGRKLNIEIKKYPAEWNKYGLRAGPLRNIKMIEENPDITLALIFHEDLKNSKGTKHMISLLDKTNIYYEIYD